MTSPGTDLLSGFADRIVAAGIATIDVPGQTTGIFYSLMPDSPDQCIVLTDYSVSDQPEQSLSRRGVQMRLRGTTDPWDVMSLRDQLFALFHGLTQQPFGAVWVDQCLQHSSIQMGRDDSNRWMQSINFYVDCDMPVTANRPY